MSKNTSKPFSIETLARSSSIPDVKLINSKSSTNTASEGLKSPLKPSLVLNRSTYNSPIQYSQKTGYSLLHSKSPNEKCPAGAGTASKENMEAAESYLVEGTVSMLNNYLKGSYAQQNHGKAKSTTTTPKAVANLSKMQKSKFSFYKYEPFASQKNLKQEETQGNTTSTIKDPKGIAEVKAVGDFKPIVEPVKDTSQKANLPSHLKLTLDKIYTKEGGSSSHRIQLQSPSPNSEFSTKFGVDLSVQRRDSTTPQVEAKTKVVPQTTQNPQIISQGVQGEKANPNNANNKDSNSKLKLNTLLVGLSNTSHVTQKTKVPKLNVKGISSVNVTPRKDPCEVMGAQDHIETTKRYKLLLGMLQEKNQEIKRLSKDKTELQSTLDGVGDELSNLRKIKAMLKEKGKSVTNLHLDLTEIVSESEEQATEIKPKGDSQEVEPEQEYELEKVLGKNRIIHSQKSMGNLNGGGKPKGQKTPTNLEVPESSSKQGTSERLRNNWIGAIGKKTSDKSDKLKTSEKSQQSSSNKPQLISANSLSTSPYKNTFFSSGSATNTPATIQGSKAILRERTNSLANNEAPPLSHKDQQKDNRDVVKDNLLLHQQRKDSNPKILTKKVTPKSSSSAMNSNRNKKQNSKEDEEVNRETNDVTVDIGLFKRKHSHDVNRNIEKTHVALKRKCSEVKGTLTSSLASEKQESSYEGLDIGKALGSLKNRIARVLNQKTDENDRKLQLILMTLQKNFASGNESLEY